VLNTKLDKYILSNGSDKLYFTKACQSEHPPSMSFPWYEKSANSTVDGKPAIQLFLVK